MRRSFTFCPCADVLPHVIAVFDAGQRFAILLLAHGGVDLDSFTLGAISSSAGPWSQCAGIFWSVALSLARAEETVRFEVSHILSRPSPP